MELSLRAAIDAPALSDPSVWWWAGAMALAAGVAVALLRPLPAAGVPRLRGALHLVAALVAVPASAWLVTRATPGPARWTALAYAASVTVMLAASANRHRGRWGGEPLRRRLDHAAIFVAIAGTYTPVVVALDLGPRWLVAVWAGAGTLAVIKVAWMKAPPWITVAGYAGPTLPGLYLTWRLHEEVGLGHVVAFFAGLGFYLLDGLIYATRWPPFERPNWGGHEWGHLFVLGGVVSLTAVIVGSLLGAI